MSDTVTRRLAEILGLPPNTVRAVLVLRHDHPPLLRVTMRPCPTCTEHQAVTKRFRLEEIAT